jgi:hypothetical protein
VSTSFISNVLRSLRPEQDETGRGQRSFHSQANIRTLLGRRYKAEDFTHAEMLLIFEALKQHTWLLATEMALYCIIDNRSEPHARRLWRIPRDDIVENGKLALSINVAELTERDSFVVIDGKRPRKFSREIFQSMSIKDSIESMLKNAFKL